MAGKRTAAEMETEDAAGLVKLASSRRKLAETSRFMPNVLSDAALERTYATTKRYRTILFEFLDEHYPDRRNSAEEHDVFMRSSRATAVTLATELLVDTVEQKQVVFVASSADQEPAYEVWSALLHKSSMLQGDGFWLDTPRTTSRMMTDFTYARLQREWGYLTNSTADRRELMTMPYIRRWVSELLDLASQLFLSLRSRECGGRATGNFVLGGGGFVLDQLQARAISLGILLPPPVTQPLK
jgi:hypothetical protein